MSTPWEKNGRGRRIIGILTDLTSSAKHGSISFVLLLINFSVWHAEAQPSGGPEHQSEYSYARFSPSMAVIIVVLIAALFIMGFFSIYIRHCSDARTGRSILPVTGGSIGGRSRRNAARGLDPSVIEKLPIFEYSAVKSHKIGKGALECAVCLNEFEDDDTLRLLPKCDHVFHPDCIDAWLSSHTTCPVCRSNLTVFTGEEADDSGNHDEQVSDQDADSDEMTRRLNAGTSEHSASIRVEVEENSELEGCADSVQTLPRSTNQNRSMRSLSIKSFLIPIFPRSHSTGHSLVQPGENLERFTLRLPEDVRKQMMNRRLNRAVSLVVLPSERSGRRGYRGGAGEGSTGGRNYRRLERPERSEKSDRWVFSITPPFFSRTGSLKSPRTGSVRSPRVAANASEGPSKNLDAV